MPDYTKLQYYSGANTFKNVDVQTTSITVSGVLAPSASATYTSVITLSENQVFAYAIAEYVEFSKRGTKSWQVIPTFDAYVASTPTGNINTAIFIEVAGNVVTFKAFNKNPYGVAETFTSTVINIEYVTYTLAR